MKNMVDTELVRLALKNFGADYHNLAEIYCDGQRISRERDENLPLADMQAQRQRYFAAWSEIGYAAADGQPIPYTPAVHDVCAFLRRRPRVPVAKLPTQAQREFAKMFVLSCAMAAQIEQLIVFDICDDPGVLVDSPKGEK